MSEAPYRRACPFASMPSVPHQPPPPRRVDAERNRSRILDAARAAFADPDADVSMAEIARRADVGQATLYRNFTNRRALLEALYVEEIEAICAMAATVGGGHGERLVEWLRQFYAYFTSKRFVAAELLEHTGLDDPVFGAGYSRVLAAARPLLAAAQRSGEARADLTIEQVLDLVAAVAKISAPRPSPYPRRTR